MEGANIMEAKEKLQWKTTEEELPPNKTLEALENLSNALKLAKGQFKEQVDALKEELENKEK